MNVRIFLLGNWPQIKRELLLKYKFLNEEDVYYEDGSEHKLLRHLQIKLDLSEKELLLELKRIITK